MITPLHLGKTASREEGYAFAGWALSPNGAKVYDDCQSVLNLTTANNALVMLFAKWTVNSYTVVYDSNGGDGGAMNPQQIRVWCLRSSSEKRVYEDLL